MHKKLVTATVAVASVLLTAGCGSDQQSAAGTHTHSHSSEHPGSPGGVDAAVVRGMTEYDFPRAASVSAAARKASTVVVGEVVGWSDGRSTVESDGSGYEDISYSSVLTIKVGGHSKPAKRSGSLVYVEVKRGGEIRINGERPEGTEPVITTVDELSSAVPAGTRVILLANPARSNAQLTADNRDVVVRDKGAGKPAGATLLRPNVQGLLFQDESGEFVSGLADDERGWGWVPTRSQARGFDYLVAELHRAK